MTLSTHTSIRIAIMAMVALLAGLALLGIRASSAQRERFEVAQAHASAIARGDAQLADATMKNSGATTTQQSPATDPGAAGRAQGGDSGELASFRAASDSTSSDATASTTTPPLRSVAIDKRVEARRGPGTGPVVGTIEPRTKYLGNSTVVIVERTTADGRFAQVILPFTAPQQRGWIPLAGRSVHAEPTVVRVDISRRELVVRSRGDVLFTAPVTVGAPSSPSPPGIYAVSDPTETGGARDSGTFGHYAFGINGLQPNLPPGWTGGNQMAIHGTGALSAIGSAQSAGCIRVRAEVLDRLKKVLRPGSPVIIEP